MEEFANNRKFQTVFTRYFREPKFNNINYPSTEKISTIAQGLVKSNTSILQMKYRKVMLVLNDMEERLINLGKIIQGGVSPGRAKEIETQRESNVSTRRILKQILGIMELAKPSLKGVQLQPNDYTSE